MKTIGTDATTAINGDVVRPVLLAALYFDGGTTFFSSSDHDISYGGNTYVGVGTLGSMSQVTEDSQIQAQSVTLSVSGLPTGGWINEALIQFSQGRPAYIYLALLDSTYNVIDTPVMIWGGTMDVMDITLGSTCEVAITVQNKLTSWEIPDGALYTDAEQQSRFPGDSFFQYVDVMVDAFIAWGPNVGTAPQPQWGW